MADDFIPDPVAAYLDEEDARVAEARTLAIAMQARLDQINAQCDEALGILPACICPPDPAAPYAACTVHASTGFTGSRFDPRHREVPDG